MRNLKPPVDPARTVLKGLLVVALLLVGLPWIKNRFFGNPNPASTAPALVQTSARLPLEKESDSRLTYAGDDACRACHLDKVKLFHQTVHHLTYSTAPAKSLFPIQPHDVMFHVP